MNRLRSTRLVVVTMGLTLLATGCDNKNKGSFAGGVETTTTASAPSVAPEAAPATTATAPLAAGSVVL